MGKSVREVAGAISFKKFIKGLIKKRRYINFLRFAPITLFFRITTFCFSALFLSLLPASALSLLLWLLYFSFHSAYSPHSSLNRCRSGLARQSGMLVIVTAAICRGSWAHLNGGWVSEAGYDPGI